MHFDRHSHSHVTASGLRCIHDRGEAFAKVELSLPLDVRFSNKMPARIPPRCPFSSLPPSTIQPRLRGSSGRQFSQSARHGTRMRRQMYQWLHGRGAVFRDALPGSTNYLNAYESNNYIYGGQLKRVLFQRRSGEEGGNRENRSDGPAPRSKNRAYEDEALDEDLDGRAAAAQQQGQSRDRGLPPEMPRDMMPFPMNQHFVSERVLSEEFRNEIYRRNVEEGHSVKVISAQLKVSVERVAAVIRLKAVENEWRKEVSRRTFFFSDFESSPKSPFLFVFAVRR